MKLGKNAEIAEILYSGEFYYPHRILNETAAAVGRIRDKVIPKHSYCVR